MRRIVHAAMSSELGLDILVAEDPHLCREVFSVSAQKPSVKGNGRQQGHGLWPQAILHGRGRCQLCDCLAHGARCCLYARLLIEQYLNNGARHKMPNLPEKLMRIAGPDFYQAGSIK